MADSHVVHGVFMRIFDCGVLLKGSSGIGKSSIALALLDRGHSLIADDAPEFYANSQGSLIGKAPCSIRHLLELRGIGIVNVAELFGANSVATQHPLDLVIELQKIQTDHRTAEPPEIQFKPLLDSSHPIPHFSIHFSHSHLYHPELVIEALVRQWQRRPNGYPAVVPTSPEVTGQAPFQSGTNNQLLDDYFQDGADLLPPETEYRNSTT